MSEEKFLANKHPLVEDPISVIDIVLEYFYEHAWKDYKHFARLLTQKILAEKPQSVEALTKLLVRTAHPFFSFNEVTKRNFAAGFPVADLWREGGKPRSPSPAKRPQSKRTALSKRLRLLVLERDGFRCRLCGKTARETKLEVDHKVPVAKGGTDSLNNLWTLCFDCNRGKADLKLSV